ncbi:hypothetical protein JOM56_009462 [Amanita muscaria]
MANDWGKHNETFKPVSKSQYASKWYPIVRVGPRSTSRLCLASILCRFLYKSIRALTRNQLLSLGTEVHILGIYPGLPLPAFRQPMVLISTPPLPPHAVDIPGQLMVDFEGNNTSFEGWPDSVRERLWFSHLLESRSLSAPEDKLLLPINDQVKQRIHGESMLPALDPLFSVASKSEAISSRTR